MGQLEKSYHMCARAHNTVRASKVLWPGEGKDNCSGGPVSRLGSLWVWNGTCLLWQDCCGGFCCSCCGQEAVQEGRWNTGSSKWSVIRKLVRGQATIWPQRSPNRWQDGIQLGAAVFRDPGRQAMLVASVSGQQYPAQVWVRIKTPFSFQGQWEQNSTSGPK